MPPTTEAYSSTAFRDPHRTLFAHLPLCTHVRAATQGRRSDGDARAARKLLASYIRLHMATQFPVYIAASTFSLRRGSRSAVMKSEEVKAVASNEDPRADECVKRGSYAKLVRSRLNRVSLGLREPVADAKGSATGDSGVVSC